MGGGFRIVEGRGALCESEMIRPYTLHPLSIRCLLSHLSTVTWA